MHCIGQGIPFLLSISAMLLSGPTVKELWSLVGRPVGSWPCHSDGLRHQGTCARRRLSSHFILRLTTRTSASRLHPTSICTQHDAKCYSQGGKIQYSRVALKIMVRSTISSKECNRKRYAHRKSEFRVVVIADRSKLAHYSGVSAWEPLSDPRVRNDPRCRIVLHMNWKAQTLPALLSGLQTRVAEDGSVPVPHDQTALPQPSTQEIVRCSPLAQVKRGLYTTPTFLVHGTADELIPWQQSQRVWQELTSRGVIAHLELIPGRPHICDTSRDPKSADWMAVERGYEFLARAIRLS